MSATTRVRSGAVRRVVRISLAAALLLITPGLAAPARASVGEVGDVNSVAAAYRVTAHVTPRSLVVSRKLSVYGNVSPGAAGKRVSLQRLTGGRWVTLVTAGINSKSKYAFSYRLTTPGANRLRVYKAADSGGSAGASTAVGVTVYRWLYLVNLDPVDHNNTYSYGSTAMNGVAYAKTVLLYLKSWDDSSYVAYNLSRGCIRFAAVVGQDDTDESAIPITAEISADSAVLWNGSVTLGQTRNALVDISGYLRLRLEGTSGDGDGDTGFGNARILCRF